MSTLTLVQSYAEEAGWTDNTVLALLYLFLDTQPGANSALADFLRERLADDNDASLPTT